MDGFKKVLFYAREYRNKYYLSVVYVLISVLMELVPYVLAYHLIYTFLEGSGGTFIYALFIAGGIALALMLKTFFLGKGLMASHEVAFDTLMGIRIDSAKKMLNTSMGKIQRNGVGAYKKSFVDDIDHLEVLIAHMIPEGLPYVVSPLLVFVILLIVDWRMALLSLGSLPFGMVAMGAMMANGMKKMEAYYRSEQKMNKTIVEFISGMEVIKIFNRTTSSYEKYTNDVKAYRDFTLQWYKESWTYMAIYSAILPCTIILMLPVGLSMVLSGTLSVSTYIFSLMITMSIGMPLMKLMEFLPNIPQLTFKISELEKAFEGDCVRVGDKAVDIKHHVIHYKNVTFAYDEVNVLKNVSFSINENEVTAIVGESGSGKSTLAKLLVKFWDVSSGSIDIGGVPIDEISIEALNEKVSYVAQDTFLFDIPIIENIRLGRIDATDQEVIEASKAAQCHDFIESLDKGYATLPGDAGDKLSGGEKQRITIARAILKNAPIIVLDEATSATDSENEDLIQEALNTLIQGKTLIVIAHRLSTIVDADQIVLMHEGELVQKGKHEELLSESKLYQKLWDAHMQSTQWDIGRSRDNNA